MATSTKSRLTGERPQQGITPDSLLALHEAGYRAVLERIGKGGVLDVGCGQGFESARFLDPGREVVGVDLRHRIPYEWYVALYTRLLTLAYKMVARNDTGGVTGITADDWFVTEEPDDTTLVLLAVARRPRRGASS